MKRISINTTMDLSEINQFYKTYMQILLFWINFCFLIKILDDKKTKKSPLKEILVTQTVVAHPIVTANRRKTFNFPKCTRHSNSWTII